MKYQVTLSVKESKKDSYDTFQRIISFPNIDKLTHAMDRLIRSILLEECSIVLDSQQGWTFDINKNGEVTMDWREVDVIKGQHTLSDELSLSMILRPMGIALTSKSCNGYVGYVHYIGKTKAKRGTVDKSRTFPTYQKLLKFVQESKEILEKYHQYGWVFDMKYLSKEIEKETMESLSEKEFILEMQAKEKLKRLFIELNETGCYIYPEIKNGQAISEQTYKEEAVSRMRCLRILPNTIKRLQEKNQVMMSIDGFLYHLDENAERAVQVVKDQGSYPYHVICSTLRGIGTVYDVLFVGNETEDWEFERPSGKEKEFIFIYSVGPFTEMGFIEIKKSYGGLIRTA